MEWKGEGSLIVGEGGIVKICFDLLGGGGGVGCE